MSFVQPKLDLGFRKCDCSMCDCEFLYKCESFSSGCSCQDKVNRRGCTCMPPYPNNNNTVLPVTQYLHLLLLEAKHSRDPVLATLRLAFDAVITYVPDKYVSVLFAGNDVNQGHVFRVSDYLRTYIEKVHETGVACYNINIVVDWENMNIYPEHWLLKMFSEKKVVNRG